MKVPFLMDTLDFRGRMFDRGRGPWLHSPDDDVEFLDFFTDVGTASLGYDAPEHQEVLKRLIDGVPIHAPNLYRSPERERAAKRLCQATDMHRVFFCNSGTEAVEAAIKLARLVQMRRHGPRVAGDETIIGEKPLKGALTPKRYKIASYTSGFHGRTLGSLACGDGPVYHEWGFGPEPEGFVKFEQIHHIPTDAAAVVLAPVFGNNDVQTYSELWLRDLKAYCRQHGILLVFDEVQSGSGRCGQTFTYGQRIGVMPDIVTLAKGIGMGFPVGACLARGEAAKAFKPGTHFSTFGGNPISCAFVNGMLDWATEDKLSNVTHMGEFIRSELRTFPFAKNVRGVGMLNAFDIEEDTIEYAAACMEAGVLIGAFRSGPGPVKVTPPLNIEYDQAKLGLSRMAQAYKML